MAVVQTTAGGGWALGDSLGIAVIGRDRGDDDCARRGGSQRSDQPH